MGAIIPLYQFSKEELALIRRGYIFADAGYKTTVKLMEKR